MSAWTVSKTHIDVLVAGVLEHAGFHHRGKFIAVVPDDVVYDGESECMDATELGRMLWRENFKSVNYRYGERKRTPDYFYTVPKKYMVTSREDGGVVYLTERSHVDKAVLAKQAHCYSYQTCEHDTYYKSRAYSVVLYLCYSSVSKIDGYNDAPWGV